VSTPETSIVIRAYNEEEHLPALLLGIAKQSYRNVELLLVDSGSFDRTREIAEAAGVKIIRINSRDFTFGHSLNVGIEAARGEFIAIVSAHTWPLNDEWLGNLIDPLRDDRVAMVYGAQRGNELSKYSERRDFETTFGESFEVHVEKEVYANNANSAIRRSLWLDHPFDEVLPGLEDLAWARHWTAQGLSIVYEPAAAIYHIHEESWTQVHRRYYREALAARWIGYFSKRDIPRLALLEIQRLASDLWRAAREGCLFKVWGEIVRFRFIKAKGTIGGIRHAAGLADPREKEMLFFDDTHKAIVVRGPGRAKMEEISLPPLRPGELIVRVAFEGICGTDLEILDGSLGYYKHGPGEYPIVPGHEISGMVVATGANVRELHVGDPVVIECIQTCLECEACLRGAFIACDQRRELGVLGLDGGYGEYIVTPSHFAHRVPGNVSMRDAALVEPLAVVLKGLRRLTNPPDGENGMGDIGVVGAGPIGHLMALALAPRYPKVTVYDRNRARLEAISRVLPTAETTTSLQGLGRHDVLIEGTGNVDVLSEVLSCAAPSSRILLLGLPYGEQRFNFEGVVAYDRSVIGSVGSSKNDFREALRLLPSLDVSELVKTVIPFDAYEEGWEMARRGEALKVLLQVGARTEIDRALKARRGSAIKAASGV
jgi:threonine dehydrogenase-like Zn-dependent dehydrogenase/glycosyltransferase involved in cell wall biosynthesis